MKIKMNTSIAGAGFALSPGEITDRFSDAEAARLIEKGFASAVTPKPKKVARKSAPKVEKATLTDDLLEERHG